MRKEPVKLGTQTRLEVVTKRWGLYPLLLLLFFTPTYAARSYDPRQSVDLIGQVLSDPLIYAFPILMPIAKIITVVLITGVFTYGNRIRRAFNIYVAVLYLTIALFQTTAVTERYSCMGRGPHEMELSAPGAQDDPAWLEKRMAEFDRSEADVGGLLENQRAEAQAAWQRFETRFPNKVKVTRQALDKVSAAAKSREAVRSEVTRLTRLVRTYLLQAGILTGVGDDVFFLSLDELANILAGDKTPIPYIPTRRVAHERYCALPPYPAMIVGHFDPFAWAADSKRRSDFFDSRQPASTPPTGTIHGYAGAAGVVEGTVRKLDQPEDGNQFQAGEILVAVTTNVGWTPLFPRLAAVVTDIGAPLSHAAIVAREMGIPAVVGCGDATMRLKTGDRVRVDGSAGTVAIL